MEDILNLWTKELEKQTKDFHRQASQVAKWDQQLIENGNKVIDIFVFKKNKVLRKKNRFPNCMKM